MIVLAREVFLCKCSTAVPSSDLVGNEGPLVGDSLADASLQFVNGTERHLALLDPTHHGPAHVGDFRTRLGRGDVWVVGLLSDRIATYTWLHSRPRCEYPYLPGCAFELSDDFGYGYDAWTQPELRGSGLRRRAFSEELRVLGARGKAWEASFFVSHQLAGARRSLAQAGIEIVPLWRVTLAPKRTVVAECITGDPGVCPANGLAVKLPGE